MDKIKIITDGSCDLSHEVLNKFNINVVPLGVSFGEEHYTAGVDIDNKEFYAKMKESKELPKTFCPSPENFCKEYQKKTGNRGLFYQFTCNAEGFLF